MNHGWHKEGDHSRSLVWRWVCMELSQKWRLNFMFLEGHRVVNHICLPNISWESGYNICSERIDMFDISI